MFIHIIMSIIMNNILLQTLLLWLQISYRVLSISSQNGSLKGKYTHFVLLSIFQLFTDNSQYPQDGPYSLPGQYHLIPYLNFSSSIHSLTETLRTGFLDVYEYGRHIYYPLAFELSLLLFPRYQNILLSITSGILCRNDLNKDQVLVGYRDSVHTKWLYLLYNKPH